MKKCVLIILFIFISCNIGKLEGKSIKDISKETGISEKTLRSRDKKRGLKKERGKYNITPYDENKILNNSSYKKTKKYKRKWK